MPGSIQSFSLSPWHELATIKINRGVLLLQVQHWTPKILVCVYLPKGRTTAPEDHPVRVALSRDQCETPGYKEKNSQEIANIHTGLKRRS